MRDRRDDNAEPRWPDPADDPDEEPAEPWARLRDREGEPDDGERRDE
jgi:hypothetical protein